jgi:hypothetical protein
MPFPTPPLLYERLLLLFEQRRISRGFAALTSLAVYVLIPDAAFPEGDLSLLPEGPSEEQRLAHRALAVDMVRTSVRTKAVCDLIGRLERGGIM